MASTTELRKSYLETAKTLTTKPLYAWAGAGDLAVEKLREVPQKVSKLSVGKLKPEVSIEKPKQFVSDVPGKISAKVHALPKSPKELQAKLPSAKDLTSKIPSAKDITAKLPSPKSLQTKLAEATEAQVKAVDAKFDELVDRGESVVKRIRSQKATTDLVSQAKTTVAKAKAVPTTAARSTRPATAAAKNTVTAVKSTATAARKTGTKAAPAAAKVGDEA